MSSLIVFVVEGVLGSQQHGSMSAARPIPEGILLYTALQESGVRVGLVTAADPAGVERFLRGTRVRGQAWTRYASEGLAEEIQLVMGEGQRVTMVVTPRRLEVERVAQCVFLEDILMSDPLITPEGFSQRRRPNWGEMVVEGVVPADEPEEPEPEEDDEDIEPRA